MLTDGASLAAGPELVAERILDVLTEPFYLGDTTPSPSSSRPRSASRSGPASTPSICLHDADTALSQAKEAGKGRYALFGQDMPQAIESRLAFENELRSAVATDQFFLRYQPIFDIETRTTTGVEALLRWQHPTRRVIPPDHFLPLARGERPDHSPRSLGDPRGVPPRCGPAPQRVPDHHVGEPLGSAARVRAPGGRRPRGAAPTSGFEPQRVGARDHRDDDHARHRADGRPAHRPEGPRSPHRHRRLRHGLLVARLPASVPCRHLEDRPLVHQLPGHDAATRRC